MRLSIGSTVLCRLFNKPDGKFYGDTFRGQVVGMITRDGETFYTTKRLDTFGPNIDLHRKEIKRILG